MSIRNEDWSERSRELARLLARVKLGDREAFAALYRHTSAHLFGVVLRINRDRAQAEEVLQEVYVKVWRSAQGFDTMLGQPLTWLTRIARNGAIDSLRRRQAEPRTVSTAQEDPDDENGRDMLNSLASEDAGPLQALLQASEARRLTHCMQDLSREQQQCIALAYYQGLSHAELAEHLVQPLGTVKSWVRRALVALKSCLVKAVERETAKGG
ncbi:sigma-70 family RNA polymerase sigma factor [Caldimonas tepidiphila]|uniref:sigma-70 family RNA polymerase sigma factor n=1 Tax=Caldimonas tepidiphila TaxID=2315841 RepID=UPI000E5B6C4F|nr:sigma-70 family RNA polymerase sigma factor [Caldimonas tepidiphila]